MRKLLLIVVGSLMVLALAAAVTAWSAVKRLGPREIDRRIRSAVKAETGLDLVSSRLTTQVSYHVIITLDGVRLLNRSQTVAHFDRIALTCGYRTLIFHRGLPFLSIAIDKPKLILPLRSVTPGPMPVLDPDSIGDMRRVLVRLSNVTRQIVMTTAQVEDRRGQVLFEDAAVTATHNRAASAWRVRMMGQFKGVALPNFEVGANLTLAPEMDGPDVPFARGSLWFWDLQLADFATRNLKLGGVVQGNLTFLVRTDGTVRGQALTRTTNLQVGGPFLTRPIQMSEVTISARLVHSISGLQVTQFAMRSEGQDLLSGAASLKPLPPDNLRITTRFAPLSLGADQLKSMLARIRVMPDWLSGHGQIITAGRMSVDQFNLDTTLKELEAPSTNILLHETALKATLDGLALTLPQIPPIAEFDGKLEYAGGLLRLTQSHASFGSSTLDQIRLSGDLSHAAARLPFALKLAGDIDTGQLPGALSHSLSGAAEQLLKRVNRLQGRVAADLEINGKLMNFSLAEPPYYRAVLRPRGVTLEVASAPSAIRLFGGTVVVSPHEIIIDRLNLAPRNGSMFASGRIERTATGAFVLNSLDLQMHQISAQEWLPSLFAVKIMEVEGPATGKLSIIRVKEGTGAQYRVDGNLGLGPGQIKFAFLRSPVMLIEPAELILKGDGGSLSINGATLEGSPLNMTVSVADVRTPLIRIEAQARKLDLEAISAVRLPWTPKAPVQIEKTPFEGHIEADEANLARLQMTSLKASFRRNTDGWRVYDISADSMGGRLTMDLTGRQRDDWVHIITGARDVEVAALEAMGSGQTVVTGRLSADADLWADTDGDFFDTLTGSLSATVKNGVLLKLKLLSRMLSLVDVSEWLNAKIPDPRVNGVPFRTMTARFIGEQGNFETSDFMLDGPVMKITAAGKIDLAQSGMNMMVGMRPFQLLDTVFNKIPLIGRRLAQSQSGIVAAYFHVQGPIEDPMVLPAPITSISHLLIKTLAIPINLLVPETIK
jgi:hypothetical protein